MQPLEHGYTNDTRGDGAVVHKRYQGPLAAERYATERAVLGRLAGLLPVPRLLGPPVLGPPVLGPPVLGPPVLGPPVLSLPGGAGDVLVMEHLVGVHGQDLIESGQAGAVLHSCGVLLRRLQQVDVAAVLPGAPAGSVLVHGDFGPNNMLFDPVSAAVTGVLDWEWAHAGDPVDDLAWCEWIIRRHHPGETRHLDRLFAGYGHRPPWPQRQGAALAKCRQMLWLARTGLARAGPDGGHGYRRWADNVAVTQGWTE